MLLTFSNPHIYLYRRTSIRIIITAFIINTAKMLISTTLTIITTCSTCADFIYTIIICITILIWST